MSASTFIILVGFEEALAEIARQTAAALASRAPGAALANLRAAAGADLEVCS